MDYGAIDLHKQDSLIRIVTADGELQDQRVSTTRAHFTAVFGGRPAMRVLLEASTESEWVAQTLEGLGHEVVVADPNFAPMYGSRRRIKTDRRDVAALAAACQSGVYRRAHRRSVAQQQRYERLVVRQALLTTRTRLINLTRALTRRSGLRLPSGSAETVRTRVAQLPVPPALARTLAPVLHVMATLDAELAQAEQQCADTAAADPVVTRLMTVPGIGPITALAFVAALDTPTRFVHAGQVTSYLGLVPREYSSGERQRRGSTLRSAQPLVQALLVQAAWRVWRLPHARTAPLRRWAQAVAARRGRRVAIVALARRLARLLFALWRDATVFEPARLLPRAQ